MNWLFLDSGKGDAALNMALDETLLESVAKTGAPVLRFYGWTQPAASFGYFQKFSEVERTTLLRPLVRRPTGGGIVPHDIDWTYSFVVPPGHEWHRLKAEESYRRIHDWIRHAFERLKVKTELAPGCKKSAPGQCFVGYEKSDVLWHGQKIAGAAQRRNQLGLLIQGSVQPPPVPVTREAWQQAMREVAVEGFSVQWEAFSPGDLGRQAEELARQKYSQIAYNQKR